MKNKDWKVYSPSYQRAETARSHKLFEKQRFCYVVREEEADKYYEKFDENFMVIPNGAVRNITETRNWILAEARTSRIIMVDDDLSSINATIGRDTVKLSISEIESEIDKLFELTETAGLGLFGLNVTDSKISYSQNKPFSFYAPILGPFSGHILDELRYDQTLTLKEDYDFFLQKIKKYGWCLRANFLNYTCDHQKLAGGCQSYRTQEEEERQNKLLVKKWGSKIVIENNLTKGSVNMRIKL